MSASCCDSVSFDGTSPEYRKRLWIVILINAVMFVVEMTSGFWAESKALQADALDFFGDTLTYTLSLAVIGHSLTVRATAALVKGISLLLFGGWILITTAYQLLLSLSEILYSSAEGVTAQSSFPDSSIMGVVGVLALAANLASVVLLLKFKDGDSNVKSVWLCSRNDAIGNIAVMFAAGGVWITGTVWPDLMVGFLMALLFLTSSWKIIKAAVRERAYDRKVYSG